MNSKKKYTFFYTTESPFSNFHPSVFKVDGVEFSCNEQFMMYSKACLFGDKEMAKAILEDTKPGQMKAHGRHVANFDQEIWLQNREQIVKKGLRAKFSQNRHLFDELMRTGDTELAEASPNDTIWGIGLKMDDPRVLDKSKWRGLNLLGKLLTEVRNELRVEAEAEATTNS